MTDPTGPLRDVRVLDLSRFIAGPLCAQMLGDFGADVVKVERPGGEDARSTAPRIGDESMYTMLYNRNKRFVTLDTRHPSAPAILRELIAWADVVVENYRTGTMAAMGLDYERMSEINPRVIHASISGFGRTGPDADRALFDAIAQAESGLMAATGDPSGEPMLAGAFVADNSTALHAVIGVLAALRERERTGRGQFVDVASLDVTVAGMGMRLMATLNGAPAMARTGNRDPLTAPVNLFHTRDRPVYIHAGTTPLFRRLVSEIGRADLAEDPRFDHVAGRMAAADELEAIVGRWCAVRTAEEVAASMRAAGVPHAIVADVADAVASPQLRARGMFTEIALDDGHRVTVPANPIKLSASPATTRRAPGSAGRDTAEVYADILGWDAATLAAHRRTGAV